MSDDFVRDLELALTAAAHRRAERRARRFPTLRLPLRRLAAAAVATAIVAAAIAGALALIRGVDEVDRTATPPPGGAAIPVPGLLATAKCEGLGVADRPAAARFPDIALFASPQGEDDVLPPPAGSVTWLPVRTFDPAETRRAGSFVAFPTLGVPDARRCGSDRGPGVCLVLVDHSGFRCFTAAEVAARAAVVTTGDGTVAGLVPDGIDRVTLAAGGKRTTVDVIGNLYEERRMTVPAGTPLTVTPAGPGCDRGVAPALRDRLPLLSRPADPDHPLPRPAREVLREWGWQLDAALVDEARFWGAIHGAGIWAVPIVPRDAAGCAPATGVCVIGVTRDQRADSHCVQRDPGPDTWKLGPVWPDLALLLAVVPEGVTAARVTVDGQTAMFEARDGIAAGVTPFPYTDGSRVDVTLLRGAAGPF